MSLSNRSARQLRLEVLGMWYTALTIALGVIALSTGNNALYLLESLLLSGMIFSGVLSERAITGVEVRRVLGPAICGERSPDLVVVRNLRSTPIFSLEISLQLEDGKALRLAFLPRLDPRAQVQLPSLETYARRGRMGWKALIVSTSGPFGFARKGLVLSQPGSRLVWPRRRAGQVLQAWGAAADGRHRAPDQAPEVVDGEVRPLGPFEDMRWAIWSRSTPDGAPMTRVLRAEAENPTVILDLKDVTPEQVEGRVEAAAARFYPQAAPGRETAFELRVLRQGPSERVFGRTRCLDALAEVAA